MGKIIYVTGGARSGKSSFAEKKVLEMQKEKIYVATAISFDDEMKERVRLHKIQRGEDWITIEGYKNICETLSEYKKLSGVVLLDCLTNMVTNNMIMDREIDWDSITQDELRVIEDEIKTEVQNLVDFIKESSLDMVVVSNEVGMGLVPPYALGRYFRDIGGRINQLVAKESHEAYLIVSGLELKLK
ncbi:MAG: bifunctional adenosylcobinamide kinase/adenosylcobinamide-phosphate guanylyltransferase [Cetobacterium sp.]|uniref:bifunctional adenosylcobinamide kinase/adenosylcobinamide-phosphate guanylyltransferase n=1 Tax=unclassified Cetobacterium TaxID=2630983 RepID=UPI000647F9DC|nr:MULTISPECIES: bifunctional adenosylcobinamide kinase/adenosylcobinamide-phosphate guanylyltransferase [unclassified Cetobacterium]